MLSITGLFCHYQNLSGLQSSVKLALETFGVDNLLFSVDYPFSTNEMGIGFLNQADLPEQDPRKIASENADRLLRLS